MKFLLKAFRILKVLFNFILFVFFILSCEKKIDKTNTTNSQTNTLELQLENEDVFKNKRTNQFQLLLDREYLDGFYKNFWVKHNLWGGFLVARNGKPIYEKYSGYSNKEIGTKNDSHRPLHIASISKVLTASLILKLIDAKYLSLDQNVCTVLRKFPYSDITIKMLLNHRSGLPKYSNFTYDNNIWNKDKFLYNKDILSLLATHKPTTYFIPGTKFNYSNTNYVILALVIEAITKSSYPKAMQDYIFDPLEMNNTFVYQFEKEKIASKSYYNNGNSKFKIDYLDMIYGDKNIYSTPQDLLKFDKVLYSDKFISKSLKDSAYKGYSHESKGVRNYGLGMRIMEWEEREKLLYHNGWWHGNNTIYIHSIKDSTTIIALGNKYSNKIYDIFNLIGHLSGYPLKTKLEKDSISL